MLDEQTRPYDAEPYYRRAAKILMRDPTRHALPLGLVMNNLAASVFAQCRLDDAERLYARALMHLVPAFGNAHPDTVAAHRNLATVRKLLGRGAALAAGAGGPQVSEHPAPQDGPHLPPACAA